MQDTDKSRLLALTVDLGEAEAIILALEQKPDLLLIDDRKARVMADSLGIPYMGTIGLLLLAHQRGRPGMDEALGALHGSQFRMSEALYYRVLRELDSTNSWWSQRG